MHIQSSKPQIASSTFRAPAAKLAAPEAEQQALPSESFSFSYNDPTINKVGRGFGGAVAGALFSGLLAPLPLTVATAMGMEQSAVLSLYKATVITCGIAGGLSSAIMPPDQNWF